MDSQEKKYKIDEMLNKLPMKDYKKALKVLPELLDISYAAFMKYKAIKVSDVQDIPYTIVVQLEQFFGLEPGSLQNFSTDIKPIADYSDEVVENKYGLTK